MPEAAIGLMAKFPEPGVVKTRLAETLGDDKACRIYQILLENVMNVLKSLDVNAYYRTVFVAPQVFLEKYKSGYTGMDNYFPQKGDDLGERMRNALGQLLSLPDCKKAMLIGVDIPGINKSIIVNAVSMLDVNDLVLGPTYDGGYYLIGLKQIHQAIFEGIEWGTSAVLERTIAIADNIDSKVGLLPKLRDLDDAEDLKHFSDIILF